MKAVSTVAASGVRHLAGVGLQALLIVGIVAALLLALSPMFRPAEGLAGINGANARGSVVIAVPDGRFAGTTAATLSSGSAVWALAECYQGGTLVYGQYVKASSNTATFTLGPTPLWKSGPADCTAEAGGWGSNGRWRAVASTTFHVSE